MLKNRSISIILSIFAFSCSTFTAAATYIDCHDCNQTQINQKVLNWTSSNIKKNEAINNVKKIVHVIDLSKLQAQSFQTRKKAVVMPLMGNLNAPRRINYESDFKRISTPQNILSKLNNIKRAKTQLRAGAQSLVIPENVISDPWEFVACAYCGSSVQNFFNNSLSGQVATVDTSIRVFAETFGIIVGGTLSETYRVNLAAGGYIIFKATLLNEPIELNIEIKSVVDSDGNSVPMHAANLPGLNIRITDPTRGAVINSYLQRFNFTVPVNVKGIVTIIDCVNNAQHACKG